MKRIPLRVKILLLAECPDVNFETASVCATCHLALSKNKISTLSKFNCFKYPSAAHFPEDLFWERLISPGFPFGAIGSLRHGNVQHGIPRHVINVTVCVDNMVKTLPHDLDVD
ncbi:uncharacterized protein TNIN_399791 [Trichonephila inaurata madagascariensis]|uniref:Uncharacterized protein n=1 Tax=Trichonephila inaurata madagascariensis TaxID=2747483 RepID=A0A8X6XVA7_9ARAC|nr:uncharacterized protein TNIN_399791 [Trichonephila inaurata madagascariensis]